MKSKKLTSIISMFIMTSFLCTTNYVTFASETDTTESTETEDSTSTDSENQESSVKLIVDVDNSETLPKNFRTSKDEISEEDAGSIDLTGLSDLNISGSGSISENGLKLIQEQVESEGYDLIDIDLRQESHGIINGMGISWYGNNNDDNVGLTTEEVIQDEITKLAAIKLANYVSFDVLANNKSVDVGELTDITIAETENELADSLGIDYLRVQVADHYRPSNEAVDYFVSSVKDLSENTWLHFHCRGGKGRTTTFMCMYDMMKNAKTVSYEDILQRQYILGGSDLLAGNDEDLLDPENSRAAFLEDFYNYCVANTDNFETSFSEYLDSIDTSSDTNTTTDTSTDDSTTVDSSDENANTTVTYNGTN